MKIRIDRAALADAVTWVSLVTPKKAQAPALSGIRIAAAGDTLTLRAFDYEVSHTATLPAEVLDDGEVLVSAALTRQIIASLKGKAVELVLEGARLTIVSGRSTYRVGTMRLDDYPTLPAMPKPVATLDAGALADLIGTVEHAAGRDKTLPDLWSVHLVADGTELSASTTDRFRIAHATTPCDGTFTADVPVSALGPSLKPMCGEVTIGSEGGLFGLSDGRRIVTMRTLDTSFPRLDAFVRLRPAMTFEVDPAELAAAAERAELVAEAFAPIYLDFTAGEIAITADSESGDGAEYVACEGMEDGARVLLNSRFLANALNAVGSGRAVIGMDPSKPSQPLTIRPVDSDRATFLVMPRKALS